MCVGIQDMKVIEVVLTIASSKHVYLVSDCICGVHVARTRRISLEVGFHPGHLFQVEDVKVVRRVGPRPKPPPDDVNSMVDEGCRVAVPARRLDSLGFDFGPLAGFDGKDAQHVVVLAAVVTTENVKLFVVKSCRVILDLGCLVVGVLVSDYPLEVDSVARSGGAADRVALV